MAVRQVRVTRAPADSELTEHPEHCWLEARLFADLGLRDRPQVRIRRGDELALYTVSGVVDADRPDLVLIGRSGRRRLDGPDAFGADIDTVVTRSDLDDDDAADAGELVERVDGDLVQLDLVALAPHGGFIERHTDDQAELVAAITGRNSWRCKGWRPDGGAHERWHITSTDIDVRSFPMLRRVARRRFDLAVAFHGFGGTGVIIGGGAPSWLKGTIRDAIDDALAGTHTVVRLATPEDDLGGDDPANIVNRLTVRRRGGVQIEQDDTVRDDHWCPVAEAVAAVYTGLLAGGVTAPRAPGRRTA